MSYLAMSAAPINNDESYNTNSDNPINKKRQTHTKTQKYRNMGNFNPINSQKVNSVLQSIHNSTPDDDNELGNYQGNGTHVQANHSDNFTPLNPLDLPPKPISIGSERTKKPEGMTNIDENLVPQPIDNDDLKLQELQSAYMNEAQVRDYYQKLVPNHKIKTYYSQPTSNDTSNQVLIEKLNYMIHLLEEQQDQKTENVTEEVVLYSFLGVFIIFVVDSFAKVGKYVR